MERIRYKLLISKTNLHLLYEDKDGIAVLRVSDIYFNTAYVSVEFYILGEEKYDTDLEVVLNTYGALAIHEEESNSICILEEDVDELNGIYNVIDGGIELITDLLTDIDKNYIIEWQLKEKLKLKDTLKLEDLLIKVPGSKNWEKYLDAVDLFKDYDNLLLKQGEHGNEIKFQLSEVLKDSGLINCVVKQFDDSDDLIDDEKKRYSNIISPWDKRDIYEEDYYDSKYYNYD